jgi:superfamily I DNA/RNA helicase
MDIIPYSRKDYRKTALRNKTEREVLSILRSWTNPRGCDWESILLSPYFHGIGEVTARNIQRKADKAKPSTMEDALGLFDRELSKRNAEGVGDFFDAWEAALPTNPEEEPSITTATKSLQAWIRKSSNTKTYESGSKKEAEEAQRRSYEAVLIERLQQKERNGLRLSEAVDEIQAENERAAQAQNNANRALAFTDQSGHIEKEEGIILSTIHLAKGREYDGVVVHQISEGSLPHFNSLRFYDNETNTREKGFRKYATFPALQKEPLDPKNPTGTLPKIWRSKIVTVPPANEVEAWEDHNNPLEEEKRLLYVAVTRAKKRLVITSRDHNYAYLPERTWEKLKRGGTFA